MAISQKDMGSIVLSSGTLKVSVFYDDSTISSSSHIPNASSCFMDLGDVVECPEDSPGVFKLASMQISLREDYTYYVGGVWWKILQGSETQFRFYLNEGSGDTYFFWGIVDRSSTSFKELFVKNEGASGTYVRSLTCSLDSMLKKIQDLPVSGVSFLGEVGIDGSWYLPFGRVFGSIAQSAFGLSSASYLESAVFTDGDDPVQYTVDGPYQAVIQQMGMLKENMSGYSPYLLTTDPLYWGNLYDNSLDLLGSLARQFGLSVRYLYGTESGAISGTPAYNLHRIVFTKREGSVAVIAISGGLEESEISLSNDFSVNSINIVRRRDTTFKSTSGPDATQALEIMMDFTFATSYTPDAFEQLYATSFYPDIYTQAGIQSYDNGTYYAGETLDVIMNYYDKRFLSKANKLKYQRKYKGLKAYDGLTTSHLNVYPGKKVSIHNGVSSKDFYAHEVRKNAVTNALTVEWREI